VRYQRYTARLADGTEARFWSPRSREHGQAIAERGRLADAKERLERA
jgi:hypothetical protein